MFKVGDLITGIETKHPRYTYTNNNALMEVTRIVNDETIEVQMIISKLPPEFKNLAKDFVVNYSQFRPAEKEDILKFNKKGLYIW